MSFEKIVGDKIKELQTAEQQAKAQEEAEEQEKARAQAEATQLQENKRKVFEKIQEEALKATELLEASGIDNDHLIRYKNPTYKRPTSWFSLTWPFYYITDAFTIDDSYLGKHVWKLEEETWTTDTSSGDKTSSTHNGYGLGLDRDGNLYEAHGSVHSYELVTAENFFPKYHFKFSENIPIEEQEHVVEWRDKLAKGVANIVHQHSGASE